MHLPLICHRTLHPGHLHSFYLNTSKVYQSLELTFPRAFLLQSRLDDSSSAAQPYLRSSFHHLCNYICFFLGLVHPGSLNFDEVKFQFSFHLCFLCPTEEILAYSKVVKFFSSRSFIILAFLFRSRSISVTFCAWCEVRDKVLYFHIAIQLIQYLKRFSFSPLKYLRHFVKNQLTICVWVYIWTLYYLLLTHISILMPKPRMS